MPEILQLAQLVELHGVAEMEVGARRIEAFLDAQRLAARELGARTRVSTSSSSAPRRNTAR